MLAWVSHSEKNYIQSVHTKSAQEMSKVLSLQLYLYLILIILNYIYLILMANRNNWNNTIIEMKLQALT